VPTLGYRVGVQGFDPAPLIETDEFPETKTTASKDGYVDPGRGSKDLEFGSFLDHRVLKGHDLLAEELLSDLERSFEAWDEARASEVVYRTDGLVKFMHRLVPQEAHERKSFFRGLGSDTERFGTVVDATDRIPLLKFQLEENVQFMSRKLHPVTEVIQGQESDAHWPAMRLGWWLRLVYIKLLSEQPPPQSLPPSQPQAQSGGGGRGGALQQVELRQRWTLQLVSIMSKALYDISESKEKARRVGGLGMPGVLGRGSQQSAGAEKLSSVSSKQLADKCTVSASKLEQWDYLASLAQFHFESELLDRRLFVDRLLSMMSVMHLSKDPPAKKDPLPLFLCYHFVRLLAGFAPAMTEEHLHRFWRLCTLNLRILNWTEPGRDPKEDPQRDRAWVPYVRLLQDCVAFAQDALPPATFRAWERDLNLAGSAALAAQQQQLQLQQLQQQQGGGGAASTSSTYSAAASLRDMDLEYHLPPQLSELPVVVSLADTQMDSSAVYSVASSGPRGAVVRLRDGLAQALGAVSGAGYGDAPHAPAKRAREQASPAPGTPAAAQALALAQQTPGPGQGDAPSGYAGLPNDEWVKFQLISNTESQHELLRHAKKVKRRNYRPRNFHAT
jgi:hypothetical protein